MMKDLKNVLGFSYEHGLWLMVYGQ